MSVKKFDVIIIGAGASGLFCAMTAGKRGKSVLVLDHANKVGKKILMSGGGKCNFTNYEILPSHFLSHNPHFVKSALSRYTQWDFLAMVGEHNIAWQEREHGQLFCENSASDIVQMLLTECEKYGVIVQLNSQIDDIKSVDNPFKLKVSPKKMQKPATFFTDLTCKSLVVATGGLSIPTMGASGFGYQVAQTFGHKINPTSAGLVPFTFSDAMHDAFSNMAGISVDVVLFNDKISFSMPVLFTHRGLSGPASLQLSNYWQMSEPIFMDLFPNFDVKNTLLTAKKSSPKKQLNTIIQELSAQLNKPLPKKLLQYIDELMIKKILTNSQIEIANIKNDTLIAIAEQLNAWQLKPSGTEGYRTAEVTRGGVDTADVSSKTMESTLQPNLYFIGEVLDVTGWLGGYNFAWAWASGFVCGESV
ncbi:NAD(P)/FAD-dependent oxidoreductase [Moraxella boevrei]|uniref:NAD(P)/FAD-dependent oxidoreductase n=1 Tax=Faucicola boevrei TaxID=346665 RepID=UPI0037358F5B